ncbi:MAG: trimethylamine methyltransferase family protein [FCB group bacterium]|nr:trimethylamine methyltransferase family protein [FCB group bacterium]MBL7027701.1 trimethylamine methyltransferase family protein [Candidatus Neomarinimicrobiota bacterium]MBL7121052.1 trimethylamine methyltransferase family protein [Candidatus Neomarinimicrobiota bacterium]
MSSIQPKISILSKEQILKVHQDSLKVLSHTGIRVDSIRARAVFSEVTGGTFDNNLVRIPGKIVEQALHSVPANIDMYNRDNSLAFSLGAHQQSGTIYGIGVTNSWYQDPSNDSVTPFTRRHVELASALGNTLTQFDLVSTPGVIQNDDSQVGEVVAALEMMANTTKPLSILISEPKQFELAISMLEHLHRDLSGKPFVLPYFNPITPLVLNEDTTDKMFSTIDRGLPFIFSSYGMSGATAPISAEGTLAMLNAELLAGLVFSQLIKPGTPIVLGSLPSVFEMQNMISAYTSQTILVNLACAEMMDHYHIPHAGTSGSGTGWGPDLLTSGTLWMNHLTNSIGKVGLAPFVGSNFDSQAFSPTTVVYADEVIRQIRQFADGFVLDENNDPLKDIHSVGPGGSFLLSEATLDQYRNVHEQHSQIWPGYSLNQWQTEGSPDAISKLREYTQHVLNELHIPEDHDSVLNRGEEFIKEFST